MNFEISKMLNPDVYDHPVRHAELIETHISWVILTGEFAYKIKKPVNFGFLDFSTLAQRQLFCEQELRLNRRISPDLYLGVVSISASQDKLTLSGSGRVLEYAVKMIQFPQSAQLDNMLSAGRLNIAHGDAIARMLANFHQTAQIAEAAADYGSADRVCRPSKENFSQIDEHLITKQYDGALHKIQQWSKSEFVKLKDVFEQRKRDGFVRECHGDLHLRNLVWLSGAPTAFDCIEFNPDLRWIDVISDIAFLIMDLHARQQHQLANRILNAYLEISGDYAGMSIMPYYLCYRALVRAKVNALRLAQKNITQVETRRLYGEFELYLALATGYTQQSQPKLIIMRGVSASGKSTLSRDLLDGLGAIRLRSDVERKRLFNVDSTTLDSNDKTVGEIDAGVYSNQATQQTYAKLAELASGLIRHHYSVIVDATFLKHNQREQFRLLAERSNIACIIVEASAPIDVLRQRIIERKQDVSDADIAVLEYQLNSWQPLHEDELTMAVSVNTALKLETDVIIDQINSLAHHRDC